MSKTTTYNFSSTDGRLRSVDFPDSTTWQIIPSDVVGLATAASGNLLATPAEAVAKVTDQHEIATVSVPSQRKTWQFRTDRFGGIIESTTALGFVREYHRDKDSKVHAVIEPDPDGPTLPLVSSKSYIGYNSSGDATFFQAADGGTTRTTYTVDLHRPMRIKDPVGNTQSLLYDNRGNLIASVDGEDFITRMIVDSRGLTTRVTVPDPDGYGPLASPITNFAYNTKGMLTTITNPDNSTQAFTYNVAGQLLTNVDELGKTTTLTYDPLGRPKSQTNRVGAVTQWQYDSASYLRKEIDPLGNATDIAYDAVGRTDTITFPDPDGSGPLTRPVNDLDYDQIGNVLFEGDARGNFTGRIPYTYDADNRLATVGSAVVDPLQPSIENYHYDNMGRVTAIDRVQYYGSQQTMPNPIPPATDAIFMTYDQMGRVKERVSRLKADENGNPYFYERFDYNPSGQLIKTTDGQGNVSTNQYDGRGLLVRESLPDPDGNGPQFPLVVSHQYDNMGRLTATDRGFGGTTLYEYNSRSWLSKVTQPDPDGAAGSATAPVTWIWYDLRGDQILISDPMYRNTTLSYDDEQRLLFQIDPDPDGSGPLSAATTGWIYDANNQVTYINDALAGTTSVFQYDALGRLTLAKEPDPDGAGPLTAPQTTYVYGAQGMQSIVDPMSHLTTYVRDARGRVTTMTDTAGSLTSYKYDFYDNLRLVTGTDPDGAGLKPAPVTELGYDPYGRLETKTELAADDLNPTRQATTSYSYDSSSNLKSLTDPNSNTTNYTFDNLNRMIRETTIKGDRDFTYDVAGNMVRSKDRNGRVVEYEYDKLDRQTEEKWQSYNTTPSVTVSTLVDGQKINEQQVVGWTVSNSVNNLAGTFTLTVGSSTTAPIAWSADEVTIQAALAALPNIGLGNISVFESEPFDFSRSFTLIFRGALAGQNMPQTSINISTITTVPSNLPKTALAQTTTQGSLVAEKQKIDLNNGLGATDGEWYLSYAGEVSAPLPASATPQQVAAELNQFAGIDNVSVTISYGYFEVTFGGTQVSSDMQQIMADVSGLSKPSSLVRRIESNYNAVGELNGATDTDLVTNKVQNLSYVRDNLGRATTINASKTNIGGSPYDTSSLVQTFSAVGDRIELSTTVDGYSQFKNNYTYDKLHRLTEVTQVGLAGATWVTPKRVKQTFNSLGQRTGIERYESVTTANPVANTAFTFDTANRLSGIAHKQGTTNLNTYGYNYDPLSRLQTVTSTAEGLTTYGYDSQSQLTMVDNVNYPDESFGYDSNGNRKTTGYSTPEDNRTVASPGGWTYQYDNEGNMTQANSGQGVWTYTWDHRNRLVKAQTINYVISYEYDVFNRLTSRGEGVGSPTSVTRWVYDEGINPVEEIGFSGNRVYLWTDAVDDLLAAEDSPPPGGSANVLWPLSDQLGTIRDIADRNSTTGVTTVVNHRRYDSFGQRVSESNAAVDLIFGYTGKLFDEATGLQNNLNRWYSPRVGKFVSQDPIGFSGGDENLYGYVGNGTTNATDPSGLEGVGHHWISLSKLLKRAGEFEEDALYVLLGAYSGALEQAHNRRAMGGISHSVYDAAIEEALSEFLKNRSFLAGKVSALEAQGFAQCLYDGTALEGEAGGQLRRFNETVIGELRTKEGFVEPKNASLDDLIEKGKAYAKLDRGRAVLRAAKMIALLTTVFSTLSTAAEASHTIGESESLKQSLRHINEGNYLAAENSLAGQNAGSLLSELREKGLVNPHIDNLLEQKLQAIPRTIKDWEDRFCE